MAKHTGAASFAVNKLLKISHEKSISLFNYKRLLELSVIRTLNTSTIRCSGHAMLSTPVPEVTAKYPHLRTHEDVYNFSIRQVSYYYKNQIKW